MPCRTSRMPLLLKQVVSWSIIRNSWFQIMADVIKSPFRVGLAGGFVLIRTNQQESQCLLEEVEELSLRHLSQVSLNNVTVLPTACGPKRVRFCATPIGQRRNFSLSLSWHLIKTTLLILTGYTVRACKELTDVELPCVPDVDSLSWHLARNIEMCRMLPKAWRKNNSRFSSPPSNSYTSF